MPEKTQKKKNKRSSKEKREKENFQFTALIEKEMGKEKGPLKKDSYKGKRYKEMKKNKKVRRKGMAFLCKGGGRSRLENFRKKNCKRGGGKKGVQEGKEISLGSST